MLYACMKLLLLPHKVYTKYFQQFGENLVYVVQPLKGRDFMETKQQDTIIIIIIIIIHESTIQPEGFFWGQHLSTRCQKECMLDDGTIHHCNPLHPVHTKAYHVLPYDTHTIYHCKTATINLKIIGARQLDVYIRVQYRTSHQVCCKHIFDPDQTKSLIQAETRVGHGRDLSASLW